MPIMVIIDAIHSFIFIKMNECIASTVQCENETICILKLNK